MGKVEDTLKWVGVIILPIAIVSGVIFLFKWLTPTPLNNDQIIYETKKCRDAGMDAHQILNGWTYDVHKIICSEKDKK